MFQRLFRWPYLVAGFVAVVGVVGFFLVCERAPGAPPLTLAPVANDAGKLVVGKPVQVSKANGTIPHEECVAAADPENPAHLLVAAIYSSEKWGETRVDGKPVPTRGIAGYASNDGGETWQVAFEHKGDPDNSFIDPALAFGADGSAHFVCMRLRMKAWQGRYPGMGGVLVAERAAHGKAVPGLGRLPRRHGRTDGGCRRHLPSRLDRRPHGQAAGLDGEREGGNTLRVR